jgi:hypothetical protein
LPELDASATAPAAPAPSENEDAELDAREIELRETESRVFGSGRLMGRFFGGSTALIPPAAVILAFGLVSSFLISTIERNWARTKINLFIT